MKKFVIIFISSLYISAIILIGFLGIRAEVNPAKIIIEVDNIVLDEVKGKEDGRFTYYSDGVESEESKIYSVFSRPPEDEINPSTGSDIENNLWNIGDTRIHYIVYIYNFNYIYDNDNWIANQSKGTYQINASVLPENASIQTLTYSSTSADISLDEKGKITFLEQYDKVTRFTITIKSTDNASKTVNVRFNVQKYL